MGTSAKIIRTKSLGFTLIELLVAIAILAVLALIAIPAFSVWMPEYRLKQAARELYSNLQRAKMGAVRANEFWGVSFENGTPGRYRIYSLGPNRQWDAGGPDDQLQNITVNLSSYAGVNYGRALSIPKCLDDADLGTDIISYHTPEDVVVFTNRGTVVNNGGFVYLSNGKGTCYAVGTPNPAGVVVLRKYDGSTWR
jgi:prepilin-type N-terminal cleavage/methylation domain-containing protein